MRRKANICTQQVRSQSGVSLCTLQEYLTHTYTYPQQTRHARNAYACVQYIRMCVHTYVHTMLLHRSSPVQVKQSMWKCLSWTLRTSPEHILLQMWHKITRGKGGEGRGGEKVGVKSKYGHHTWIRANKEMCLNKFVLTVDCAGASYVGTYVCTYVGTYVRMYIRTYDECLVHTQGCTYILQGKYLTSRGYLHLAASGYIWLHLGAFGCIWVHLGASGCIWVHLGGFGAIWL